MTLKEMASSVRNHVVDGLDGVAETSFSIEQLRNEILLTAPGVISTLAAQGLLKADKLSQRIDGIKLECEDISNNPNVPTGECKPHFELPRVNLTVVNPITYIGTVDHTVRFKVYYDMSHRYHMHRTAGKSTPYAVVNSSANGNGLFDVYLYNLGRYSKIRYVSVIGLFENPYDFMDTEYFEQIEGAEFYAPLMVQNEIINALSQRYINYYRQLHQIPKINTQQN